MLNWYEQTKKLHSYAGLSGDELPFVQAQVLLAEVMKKMPPNHPLKGKAYYAGGAVRDELLGQIPKDLDITVEYPQGGIAFAEYLAKLLDLRAPVTYPTYGTAQLELKDLTFDNVDYKVGGVEVELVQTRGEDYSESEGRDPRTYFSTKQDDVERRDLTVNALLKKLESGPSLSVEEAKQKVANGDILDLTGQGVADIEQGIVRAPGDPDRTYMDDPLRMLRAIRFSVKYGWPIAEETKQSIIKNNRYMIEPRIFITEDGRQIVKQPPSRERVRDELDKIAGYGMMHAAIPLMDEAQILQHVMPEMYALKGVEQDLVHHSEGDAYEHTLRVIEALEKNNPDAEPYLVWAAIAHDWGKLSTQERQGDRIHFYDHEKISADLVEQRMRELKYPNDVIKKTRKLVRNHMRGHQSDQWSEKAYRKFHREMGDDLDDVLALLQADEEASIPAEGEPSTKHKTIRETMPTMMVDRVPQRPVLNGNQVIEMIREQNPSYRAGTEVGRVMSLQMDIVMGNPMLITDNPSETEANIRQALEADPRYQEILQEIR